MIAKRHSSLKNTGFFLLTVVLAGCADPSKLPPKYTVGQQWTHEVKVVSRMLLPIGIPNADTKETSFRLECLVQQVDAAGNSQIRATLKSVAASMNSLGKKYQYDNAAPTEAAAGGEDREVERQQQFAKAFSELLGQSYGVEIDPHGAVKNLTNITSPLAVVAKKISGGTFGGEQAAMVFFEGYLQEYVAPGVLAAMPAGTLEPNKPWTHEEWLRVPLAVPVRICKRCVLDRWENIDGGKVAVITYTVTAQDDQLKSDTAQPGGELMVVGVEGKGTVRFLVNEGRMDSWEEVVRAQVRSQQSSRSPQERSEKNKIFYVVNKTVKHQS